MSDFETVARVGDIADGGKFCTDLNDRFIVLVRLGNEYFCIDDVCTHDGGPLGEGALIDHCLECPRHGARFDVRTGAAVCMPATEPTASHEVRVVGDEIQVRLQD